jgi:hypothetical protein
MPSVAVKNGGVVVKHLKVYGMDNSKDETGANRVSFVEVECDEPECRVLRKKVTPEEWKRVVEFNSAQSQQAADAKQRIVVAIQKHANDVKDALAIRKTTHLKELADAAEKNLEKEQVDAVKKMLRNALSMRMKKRLSTSSSVLMAEVKNVRKVNKMAKKAFIRRGI